MVEKKGRKPLAGERYPCGKRRPTDFRSEGQFQRMKEHAMSLGLDPMMTSQAGRLFCVGLLTSRHMATIDYIAKVYAAYEKHAGKGTRRRTRSPSYEPPSTASISARSSPACRRRWRRRAERSSSRRSS